MRSDSWNIAKGCGIGAMVCTAASILCLPQFWWVGFPVGLVAGWVAYNFREVLTTIPTAATAAWQKSHKARLGAAKELRSFTHILWSVVTWFFQPHHFLHPAMVIVTIRLLLRWPHMFSPYWLLQTHVMNMHALAEVGVAWCLWLCAILAIAYPVSWGIALISFIGVRGVMGQSWNPRIAAGFFEDDRNLTKHPLVERTYTRAAFWFVVGLYGIASVPFRIVGPLVEFAFEILNTATLLPVEVFLRLHSDQRALCAVDGTLGGTAAYWFYRLHPQMANMQGQVAAILFAAILGVGWGMLNWELLSKRLLHGLIEQHVHQAVKT